MKEPIYNLEKLLANLSFLLDKLKDLKDNYYELPEDSIKSLRQVLNGSIKTVKEMTVLFDEFF